MTPIEIAPADLRPGDVLIAGDRVVAPPIIHERHVSVVARCSNDVTIIRSWDNDWGTVTVVVRGEEN